jgi:hypothetical protein
MLRFTLAAVAAICLLLAPAASVAEWNTQSGTSPTSVVTSVNQGQCVYERQTATGQGSALQAPIAATYFKLNANVAGTDEGDVEVEVRRCPHGTITYDANVCQRIEYKNAAGTVVSVIDGDLSDGMDAVYEVRGSVYFLNTTTHPQGTTDSGTTVDVLDGSGTATAGSTVSVLEDTGQSWDVDEWIGYRVENTTESVTVDITDSTETTLSISPDFATEPDGDSYRIIDGTGTITDTAQDWADDDWNTYQITNTTTGESSVITDTLGTPDFYVTVSPAFTTAADFGDSYIIFEAYRTSEVEACVDDR